MKNTMSMRTILFILALAGGIALLPACDGGREGDRCNPNLSHVDCNDGLACIAPSSCAETYCCPSDPTKSTSQYCNGTRCPHPIATDAGTTDAQGE